MKWSWIAFAVLLAGCANATDDRPRTFEDVRALLSDRSVPICNLDISALDVDLNDPSPDWAVLTDPDSEIGSGAGASLEQAYRRAALRRRLMAGTVESGVGRVAPYAEYADTGVEPGSLPAHRAKVDYWQEKLGLIIEQMDKMGDAQANANPAFNLRFCVVNERGGADRAAARQAALDAWEDWPPGDRMEALETGLYLARIAMPSGEAYRRTWLAKLAQDDTLTDAERGVLALTRDRGSKIVPTDPTDVAGFYAQREQEIAASLAYIESQDWPTVADEFRARVALDQSMRGLRRHADHFDTPIFGEGSDPDFDLWTLTATVDASNTQRLKTLLQDRDWFRDDRDGDEAAYRAWLLAQHADRDPDFQRDALRRMKAALGRPGVRGSEYAYLWDRVAGKDNRPQRYGTQGSCQPSGAWQPHPMKDPDAVDALRITVGLGPMSDYVALFDCPVRNAL